MEEVALLRDLEGFMSSDGGGLCNNALIGRYFSLPRCQQRIAALLLDLVSAN